MCRGHFRLLEYLNTCIRYHTPPSPSITITHLPSPPSPSHTSLPFHRHHTPPSPSITHSHSLSLTHSLPLTLIHSHSLSLPLTLTHSHSHSLSLTPSLSLIHSLLLIHCRQWVLTNALHLCGSMHHLCTVRPSSGHSGGNGGVACLVYLITCSVYICIIVTTQVK